MHELIKRYAVLLLTSFFIMGIAQAQVQPELAAVFPQGGQQGTTVDVTLKGKNIGSAAALWFSGSGLTAEIQEKTGEAAVLIDGAGVTGHIPNDASLTATVTIAPDAPLGIQQIRIVTPYGVSNALSFVVGELPEIIEEETAEAPNSDNWLELPITVNGDINSIDDEDRFSFNLKKGARLICDVTAQRMGSLLDSYLVLRNADGKEVANSGMGSGFDSLLDYTAVSDGKHTLHIRDIRYKGGEGYGYRLRIGELPYLETIFPLGGRRGSENTIAVSGANLETVASIQLSIGAETPTGEQSLRVRTPSGLATNAHPFAIGNLAEITETEPNNTRGNANAVTVPITLNGKIGKAEDADLFSFKVEAAQRLVFEVEALTLSSQLDALLTLYGAEKMADDAEKMETWGDEKEQILMVNDDVSGADARIEWLFEEAGTYAVSVRELNNQGGEKYPYRLSIRPLQPDCKLNVIVLNNRNQPAALDNPRVSRGSSVTMQVDVTRLDGFNGPIRLTCPALPKTFELSHTIIEPGQNRALLTVTAPWDAPLGLMPLSIIGVCAVGSKQIERTATPDPILLTVMEAPRFTLTLAEIGLSVIHNKSVNLHVTANRRGGFVGPIALSVVGLPNRVTAAPITIAEGETEATLSIKAGSFERREQFSVVPTPGTSYVSVTGTATINSVPVKQSTPAIPLTIVEAPFIVTVEPLRFSIVFPKTDESGVIAIAAKDETSVPASETVATKEAMLTLAVVRQGGFTDAVTLTPMDLPEGITTSVATIPANETEVEVPLQALASLKPDTYTFKFRGTATINGKLFAQDSPLLSVKIIH